MAKQVEKFYKRVQKTKGFEAAAKKDQKNAVHAAEGHMLKQQEMQREAEKDQKTLDQMVDQAFNLIGNMFVNSMDRNKSEIVSEIKGYIDAKMQSDAVRLAELEVEKLKLQVELARIQSGMQGKVEEVIVPETHGKLEEIVEESKEIVNAQFAPAMDLNLSTPIRYGRRGLTVAWKEVDKAGLFETLLVDMIIYAVEQGVDPSKSADFKKLGSTFNGAYQQFGLRYKGIMVWKEFVQQHVALV